MVRMREEQYMADGHESSSGPAPSADTVKERLAAQDTNLGSGDQEPDPATEGDPPAPGGQGDQARDQD